MDKQSVRVVARLTARPEKAADLALVLQGLVAPTRKEKGCVMYELLRNLSDPCDFVFVEEWTDNAALEAHFATPHLQNALVQAKPLLGADSDIRKYSLVE
jgi:quinol monooxygenase YgiN